MPFNTHNTNTLDDQTNTDVALPLLEREKKPVKTAILFKQSIQELLTLGVPIMATNILLVANSVGAGLILSTVDEDTLAASALINVIQAALVDVTSTDLTAIAFSVGGADAQQNYPAVKSLLKKGWLCAVIITAGILPVLLTLEPILLAAKQPPEVARITQEYFNYYALAFPAVLLGVANRHFLYGLSHASVVTWLNLVSTSLTLSLGYILVNGKFGLTPMGAAGMGLANAISWLLFASSTLYIYKGKTFQKYFSVPDPIDHYGTAMIQMLKGAGTLMKNGFPIAIGSLTDYSLALSVSLLIGYLGEDYLIPQGILTQYLTILITLLFGLCEPLAISTIRAMAENRPAQVAPYFSAALLIGLVIATTALILFTTIADPLFYLFYKEEYANPALALLFKDIALVGSIALFADCLRIMALGSLVGLGDGAATSKINVLSLIILGMPALLVAVLALEADTLTVNIIRGAVIGLSGMLMLTRWQSEHRLMLECTSSTAIPPSLLHKSLTQFASLFGSNYKQRQVVSLSANHGSTEPAEPGDCASINSATPS